MRALLLGANGMLARDLRREAPDRHEIVGRDIDDFDLTDADAVERAVNDIRPDLILNAAAYTNVDGAETERRLAFAVNGEAPGYVGRAARGLEIPVVHYSTDYVFGGEGAEPYREDDPTQPLGVYGASKLEGERRLLASRAQALVIRTQWLFGVAGKSFPATMWRRARAGQPTRVVNDQTGRPTYTVDLARATWRLIAAGAAQRSAAEIIHVANGGRATWYELAQRVFAAAGRPELLEPCTTAEFPTAAPRPGWSVLSTEKYQATAGEPLPAWQDALDRFLGELQTRD